MRTQGATISFGLVNIPVGIGAVATEKSQPRLTTLHEKCSTPLKQLKHCPSCDLDPPESEQVKGYEYAKGQFLRLTEAEAAAGRGQPSSIITIDKFLDGPHGRFWILDKACWLVPSETAPLAQAYWILHEAMIQTGKIGFGTCAPWGKERRFFLFAENEGLVLAMLHGEENLNYPGVMPPEVSKEALELGTGLIDQLTGELDEHDLELPKSRQLLAEIVAAKLKGAEYQLPLPEAEPQATVDVLDALRASLKQGKKKAKA